jgi:hypothetical protein
MRPKVAVLVRSIVDSWNVKSLIDLAISQKCCEVRSIATSRGATDRGEDDPQPDWPYSGTDLALAAESNVAPPLLSESFSRRAPHKRLHVACRAAGQ